ncbi:restriction endonuclease subunit S [Diaphorobacter nitroreducens]|uniref:restriction endonuclease subunit S n=1 Tax=Diaphorobacter nitroreducens TaxID=164759 RepID=UPI0035E41C2B
MYIAPEIEAKYSRTRLKGGEVLITIVGSVGQVAVAPSSLSGFNVARAVAVIHPLPHIAPEWIGLCLRSPLSQHLLGSRANTTVQTTINLKDLRALPVPLPPKEERQVISAFVGALDDRITLLRETNATLEAIAQALFKSWFVDFDPVRAKMEGRAPEGMDDAMAALFPNSFEETELGVVPKGWKIGNLASLMRLHKGSVNPGTLPHAEFQHFSLPAFDAGQMPIQELGGAIKSNKTSVPEDAVLVSKLNPHIPRVWLPSTVGQNAVCSTEFLPFVPAGPSTTAFVYSLLAAPDFSKALSQLVTGTSNSHQRVKPDGVLSMPGVIPPVEVVASFDFAANGLLARLKANRQQAQTLSTLRDTLLPRLISGQLRLPEAHALIESATV